jgi:hemolysin activation/secretion protein
MNLALELLNDEMTRLRLAVDNTGDDTGIYRMKLRQVYKSIAEIQELLDKE